MVGMLEQVIAHAFEREVGCNAPGTAFVVPMRTRIDYDTEEGYRYLDLLLTARSNYVSVFARRRWVVISTNDLVETDDGDVSVAPGRDYTTGEGAWQLIACHDSGWRDAVRRLLFEHRGDITGFLNPQQWYEVRDLSEEEAAHFAELLRADTYFTGRVLPAGGMV